MKGVTILVILTLFLVGFVFAEYDTDDSISVSNAKAVSEKDVSVTTDNPTQEQRCAEAGRTWREFSNGCVDSCDYNRYPETIDCTQALTMGCDCGEDKCWNGKKCEVIEREDDDSPPEYNFQISAPLIANAVSINKNNIEIEIRNGKAETITITNIKISSCTLSTETSVVAGELRDFSISCPQTIERVNYDVTISYTTSGSSVTQQSTGYIKTFRKYEKDDDEESDKVCCHKFGYGREMEIVDSKYLMIDKDDCVTPEDFVGGGREIVRIEKCEEYRNRIKVKNRIKANYENESECPDECTCSGTTVKCNLEGGRVMTVTAGKSGNIIVQVKEVNMSTKVELYKNENGTVVANFRGKEKELKVLPDEVQEKLRQRIQASLVEHNITLDENGMYQVQAKKRARLFFMVPVKERVKTIINSETGEITRIRTSWWGFLARDIKRRR